MVEDAMVYVKSRTGLGEMQMTRLERSRLADLLHSLVTCDSPVPVDPKGYKSKTEDVRYSKVDFTHKSLYGEPFLGLVLRSSGSKDAPPVASRGNLVASVFPGAVGVRITVACKDEYRLVWAVGRNGQVL